MGGITMVAQLLLGLSILVFIHELGHFLAAKLFNMRVDKFFIFFDAGGKKLWSQKVGETEYGIGWLPLGGYVKIAGMVDESMDSETLKEPPKEWEFRSKPAWQRFIVMIAGIVMNVILGLIIFTFFFMFFEKEYLAPKDIKDGIYAFELAEKVGLKSGDKIVKINGSEPGRFKDMRSMAVFFGGELEVERGGQNLTIQVPDTLFRAVRTEFIAPYHHNVEVVGVAPDSPAGAFGLENGDIFRSVNGKKVENFGDLKEELTAHRGGLVKIGVERNKEIAELEMPVTYEAKLGFGPTYDYKALNPTTAYTWGSAMKFGAQEGWEWIYYNALGLYYMVSGKVNPAKSIQSPVGIARNVYGPVWEWGRFWYITGILSFILAFMNILPIPALDGGHMMFLLFEMVTGRQLSDNFLEKAQIIGFLILIPLMLFAIGKDIYEAIFGPI